MSTTSAEPITKTKAAAIAPQMHAGGWSIYGMVRYFEGRGLHVSWWTVKRWALPEWAEQEREANRVRMRHALRARRNTTRPTIWDDEAKLTRLRMLREAGMQAAGLVVIARAEFGDELSRDQVKYALEHGAYPKRVTPRPLTVKEAA